MRLNTKFSWIVEAHWSSVMTELCPAIMSSASNLPLEPVNLNPYSNRPSFADTMCNGSSLQVKDSAVPFILLRVLHGWLWILKAKWVNSKTYWTNNSRIISGRILPHVMVEQWTSKDWRFPRNYIYHRPRLSSSMSTILTTVELDSNTSLNLGEPILQLWTDRLYRNDIGFKSLPLQPNRLVSCAMWLPSHSECSVCIPWAVQ